MRELHPKIKSTKELSKEAFTELKKFQVGDRRLIKTGRPFIDNHLGGLLPSSLWLHSAPSGVGKTTELMRVINNIFDENLNPDAKDFVSLEYSGEMRFLDLIVREAHKMLKKKKSEVLTQEFSSEEKELIKQYYNALQEERRFIVEETINSREFFEITDDFCSKHTDKSAIIVTLDHLLLVTPESKGEDTAERIATYTNILRKKYNNIYFIFLSQTNRSIYANIKEKSNDMVPTVASIYGSSHFEFLSAYVTMTMNPFKMGVQEYMKVKQDRYPKLKEFMTNPDSKGNVNFKTLGCMFTSVLKVRDSDDVYDNLHIERMDLSEEQLNKMKMDVQAEEKVPQIVIPPNFDYVMGRDIKPTIDLTEAFDV